MTPAAELAVTLSDVKNWLKVSVSDQDGLITSLIEGATASAEKWTKRDLINKTYKTFRDNFSDFPATYGNFAALVPQASRPSGMGKIELRRSRLQSVESVKYYTGGVLTLVPDTVYYSTEEIDFSRILLIDGQTWPSDIDNRLQAVEIEFIAGYGADSDAIPSDLKTAIKMHVAQAYENRGDCNSSLFLPKGAQGIYNQYRIMDIASHD